MISANDKHTANIASVSMADEAVIKRGWSRDSKGSSITSPLSAWVARAPPSSRRGRCILLTKRRATGPPIRPPATKPNVAAAMPKPVAPVMPYWCSNTEPQAPAVPWPPVSVTEPAIRPMSGSSPMALAKPTPTLFCSTINTLTMTKNTNSGTPPARRREKSALRPMEVKNISIKASCSDFSNLKLAP